MKNNITMKQVGRWLLFGLLLTMSVLLPNNVVNAEAKKAGNITWEVVDNVLYISPVPGTNGVMNNYEEFGTQPWEDQGIQKVIVNPGVTVIGEYAFAYMDDLTRVELPDSVTTIKKGAFEMSEELEYVNIPSKVTYIGDNTFAYITSIFEHLVVDFQGPTLPKMGNDVFDGIALCETAILQVQNPNVKLQLNNYVNKYDNITIKVTGKTPIKKTVISGIINRYYTGKAITQTLKIKLGTYQLKKNTDYKVTYVNNVNVGTATVKIQGIGAFTGVIAKTFKINTTISKKTASIYVGKTIKLSVKGTKGRVKWTSSNKKIATVDKTGKVLGKKKGTATITATVGSKKLTCKVTVKNLAISKSSLTLYVGSKETIKVNGIDFYGFFTSNIKS